MLNRTRDRLAHTIKLKLFQVLNFQAALDEQEKNELEAHMGFKGQWEEHRRFQMAFLMSEGLKPHHRLIEVGCGPLTAALPLIDYMGKGNYTGVDVRSEVLDLAWQQVGKAKLSAKNPRLINSHAFGAETLAAEKFDFIWAFSVLYHLTDPMLGEWLDMVAQRAGVAYANVNVDVESSTWLQFPFLKRSIADYERLAAERGLKAEQLGTLEELGFRLSALEAGNPILRFTRA